MDILGCTGTVSQRATVLHKVILLAQALREQAHDLFSFSAVMKALEMPQVPRPENPNPNPAGCWRPAGSHPPYCCSALQIMRLEMTWRALRRNHTDTAVLFEKKLKPFMNSLNDGDSECQCTREGERERRSTNVSIILFVWSDCITANCLHTSPSTIRETLIAAGRSFNV